MKAILLARVSTEEQREAGNSLPAQLKRLEDYCKSKGFDVIQTYSFDESAYKKNRKEFDKFVEHLLKTKEPLVAVIDKVDRLSRDFFDKRIGELYNKATIGEIEIHFVNDAQILNINTGASEKFTFSIKLGLAKYYSDAISDSVKRSREQMIREKKILGKVPYGYKNERTDDDKQNVVVNRVEAEKVLQLFTLYAGGNYSIDRLSDYSKDNWGVRIPSTSVERIISNKFYIGINTYKKTGEEYPHKYEQIIPKYLFDKVQEVKEGKSNFKGKNKTTPASYYSGSIIKCSVCGCAISPEYKKKIKKFMYSCTQSKRKHGAKYIMESVLTDQLADAFSYLSVTDEVSNKILEGLKNLNESKFYFTEEKKEELNKQKTTLNKSLQVATNKYLSGNTSITDKEYEENRQQILKNIELVNRQIEAIEQVDESFYITAKSVLAISRKAKELFLSSEVDERKALLNNVLLNLTWNGEKLSYSYKKPFDIIAEFNESPIWGG